MLTYLKVSQVEGQSIEVKVAKSENTGCKPRMYATDVSIRVIASSGLN